MSRQAIVHKPPAVALGLKTRVDVPASVSRIDLTRKPDDDIPEIGSRHPDVGMEQLMDRGQEPGGVCGVVQRLPFDQSADDWLRPGVRVRQVDPELSSRKHATLMGDIRGERRSEGDVTLLDEPLDFITRQQAADLSLAWK